MRVTFYQRRPQGANFSVERLFSDVRNALPDSVNARVAVSRFPSRGFFRRIYNMLEAVSRQGDINHITGDVHFLTYFLSGKRTLLTILDLVSAHRLKGWRRAVFLFFWYWLPVRRAKLVSVISEFTRQELLSHVNIDPARVRIVPACVSGDFSPDPKEFNSANPVILQIGSGQNKNIERVIQALKGISCHYRIIGKLNSCQLSALQNCGISHSSVSNISNPEVADEYRRCDMLVFASTYEGFGLPILEAQATGRPVVAGAVCSMPEVAGQSACLVDPFDVDSIRAGILKVIENRTCREELVRLGFENVKRFSAEKIALQYTDIYMELLADLR